MSLFRVIVFMSLGLSTLLIAGCAITQPKNKDELCSRLKRQIVYNATNLNVEAHASNALQRDILVQQYLAAGCE